MILPIHILIALSSLAVTGYILFRPSQAGLKLSYLLVALTIVTGFYLVMAMPVHLTQTCATGLVFLGFAAFGIVSARHKVAK